MILVMKAAGGNRHDSSQRYFDGILAHEADFRQLSGEPENMIRFIPAEK